GGQDNVCTVCPTCSLCKRRHCYLCPKELATNDVIGCHEPMHAVLHDTTAIRHEPVHAVLHDATGVCRGQICLAGVYDTAATMDLTASAILDTKDDAEHDAISTMPLRSHLSDHAAAATAVHVQPDGYGDPSILPAALCWYSIL
ncbi:unnamed protein product, partial [Urochloa humidicola]